MAISARLRAGAAACVTLACLVVFPVAASYDPSGALPAAVVSAADGGVRLDRTSAPVRIQIPAAGVDLPVVSSRRNVRGNPAGYPLCDVAQYWTRYDLPGAPGTTWIYAHAQPGMFLPLLLTAQSTGGSGLIGMRANVQLKDGRLLSYRINEVKQNVPATNLRIARRDRAREHLLILQTSEGPPGTGTRLQMAASLVDASRTQEPAPKANPRACSQPASANSRGNDSNRGRNDPGDAEVVAPDGSIDPMTLLFGTGAVLFGAVLVAVYMVRRTP
jgi:hypothetical protein